MTSSRKLSRAGTVEWARTSPRTPARSSLCLLKLRDHRWDAFETRGEVVMNRHGFERLNDERERQGQPRFANPRNAAAGSLRVLEPAITASRPLDYYVYGILVERRVASGQPLGNPGATRKVRASR